VADTINVVFCPGVVVRDVGCAVIVGAVHEEFTVTVAVALSTVPHALKTRTQ
jgi:hypothetical protein